MSQPTYGNGVYAPVAGQPDPRGPSSSTYTYADYANAVLQREGWPVTQSNVQWLVDLMTREGSSAANNPMDSTKTTSDSWALPGNTANVQQYPTFDEGVNAALATIKNGNYPNIIAALQSGDALSWDRSGRLARDLHTWSAGPNAPMSKGYTSVAGENGDGTKQVAGNATAAAAAASGGGTAGMSLNDVMLTYAPELAQAMSDPEIKNLVNQLDAGLNGGPNGISVQQFETQLEQTNWWKTTDQNTRSFLSTQATDPATINQNIADAGKQIDDAAKKMGVGLQGNSEYALAVQAVKENWTTQQLQDHLATYASATAPQAQTGTAGATLQQLKALYAAYALPAGNDATLTSDLQQVLAGTTTVAEFGSQLAQQAKSLYGNNPDLAAALDRGQTVQQYMTPYANVASQRLGVDPSLIDWTDPKWNAALTGTTDPANGRTTPMSLMQWQQNIMTNPVYGWSTSQDGISQATNGAKVLAQGLGLSVT
jgi:hypothetical protein